MIYDFPVIYNRFKDEITVSNKIDSFTDRLFLERKKENAIHKNWKYRIQDRRGKQIFYEYLDENLIIIRDSVTEISSEQILFEFYVIKKESLVFAFSKLF